MPLLYALSFQFENYSSSNFPYPPKSNFGFEIPALVIPLFMVMASTFFVFVKNNLTLAIIHFILALILNIYLFNLSSYYKRNILNPVTSNGYTIMQITIAIFTVLILIHVIIHLCYYTKRPPIEQKKNDLILDDF